jgi:streptogramin lyase
VNDDFVTRLGHALREAADREERRTARTRALLTAGARVPRLAGGVPVAAVLALGVVLLVGVYALLATRPEPAQPPGPKVVARLAPGAVLDQVQAGFGSAWAFDAVDDALLRLDPATGRVTARIGVRAGIALRVGSDAVWVSEGVNDLVRIDPRTNRVVARIPLERGAFSGGVPLPIGNVVWVVGEQRALRIDARTNRMTKAITVAHSGYAVRGGAVLDGDLWLASSDLRLVQLDGRTGAVKATFRTPFGGEIAAFAGGLYLANPTQVVRLDPASGRVLWRARYSDVGAAAEARGLIWAESRDRNGDRVIAIDPSTGRTVTSVHVGEFGALSMARIGSNLWMTTAGGHLIVIRP